MNTPDSQPRPVVGQPLGNLAYLDPDEISTELILAAKFVHNWMEIRGDKRWQLMDICSRDHAYELATQAATIARLREELATWREMAERLDRKVIDEQRDHVKTCGYHDRDKAKLTAYQQAADAVLKKVVGTTSEGRGWLPDNDETRQLLDQLAAAHRTATAHDGEREKT